MGILFWICIMVVFLIIEAFTVNMVSIWFAIGAAAAAACSALGFGDSLTVSVFAVASAVALAVFKRFFAKKFKVVHQPTNSDRLIGKEAIVTEDIKPMIAGAVDIEGLTWSAKSDSEIKKGTIVEVQCIQGVKLVVKERVNVND